MKTACSSQHKLKKIAIIVIAVAFLCVTAGLANAETWTLSRFTLMYPNGDVLDSAQTSIVTATGTMTLAGTRLTQSFNVTVRGYPLSVSLSATITGIDGPIVYVSNDSWIPSKFVILNDNPLTTLTMVSGYAEVDQWVPSPSYNAMRRESEMKPHENEAIDAPLGGVAGALIESQQM